MKKGVKNTSVHWLTHFRLSIHAHPIPNIETLDQSLPTIPKGKKYLKKTNKSRSNLQSPTLEVALWSAFPV